MPVLNQTYGIFIKSLEHFKIEQELQVVYDKNKYDQQFMNHCTLIQDNKYEALLRSPHMETIFSSSFRPGTKQKYKREIVQFDDGGVLALDWALPQEESDKQKGKNVVVNEDQLQHIKDQPILIILAGAGGSSQSTYVKQPVQEALQLGMVSVVFTWRGLSNMKLKGTPSFFGKTYTSDLNYVVGMIRSRHPSNKILMAGYSIGANIIANFLAKDENAKEVYASVVLGNPFDMVACRQNIGKGFKRVYDKFMTENYQYMVSKNTKFIKQHQDEYNINLKAARKAKNLYEFDSAYTVGTLGYKDVQDYDYDTSSGRFVDKILTPILFIGSINDPITVNETIPMDKIKSNPNCILVMTPFGGHLGWTSGKDAYKGISWAQKLMFQFFGAILQENQGRNNDETQFGQQNQHSQQKQQDQSKMQQHENQTNEHDKENHQDQTSQQGHRNQQDQQNQQTQQNQSPQVNTY